MAIDVQTAKADDRRSGAIAAASIALATAIGTAGVSYVLPAGRKGGIVGAGLGAAALGGIALLLFPQVGLHLMALLIPWERYQIIPGLDVTVTKLLGAFLSLVAVVHLVGGSVKGVPRAPFDLPLAAFFGCCLLSLVFAVNPVAGLVKLASFFSYAFLAYTIPAFLVTKKAVARSYIYLWASIVAVSLLTILQVRGIVPGAAYGDQTAFVGGELVERSAGTSTNPAVFIAFPVFGIGLALGIVQSGFSLRIKAAAVVSLAVLALTVYWSYTRSALMGIAAMGAAYGLFYTRQRLFWLPLFGVLGFAALLVLPPQLVEHFVSGFKGQEVSAGQRVLQYRAAWEILNETYFRGIGFANTDFLLKGYRVDFDLNEKTLHSLPFTFLLETGIHGFAAFAWLVAATLHGFHRAMKNATDDNLRGMLAGVSLGFIGYLAHTLFHHVPYLSLNGIVAGIGAAAWNVAVREQASIPEAEASP